MWNSSSRFEMALRRIGAVAILALASAAAQATAFGDFFIDVRNDRVAGVQKWLSQGMSPNTRQEDGSPALMEAIKEDAWGVYDLLLKTPGVDLNIRNPVNETPLMYLAIKGETKRAAALIERGAEVNQEGWTALHYAATVGNLELIDVLVKRGAKLDARAPGGTTPLMMAARHGRVEAAKRLLGAGADSTLRADLGMDAADFAASQGHGEMSDALRDRILQDRQRRGQP